LTNIQDPLKVDAN